MVGRGCGGMCPGRGTGMLSTRLGPGDGDSMEDVGKGVFTGVIYPDLETIEDEFMRKGIRLVVDRTDPEIIKNILYNDLEQLQERHGTGIKVFDDWGKIAPAFGMIGTLTGLIAMLANLGGDSAAIGSGMALALITTMYGAIFANLVLIPLRSKLEGLDKEETRAKEIIVEGVLSIQSGDNPRTLGEKLIAFLPPADRTGLQSELE